MRVIAIYLAQVLGLAYLSVQDIRKQTVSLASLLFVMSVILVSSVFNMNFDTMLLVMVISVSLVGVRLYFMHFRQREIIATADLVLICLLVLSLDLQQIPLFLMLLSFFGFISAIIWQRYLGVNRFPFVPAITASYILGLVS